MPVCWVKRWEEMRELEKERVVREVDGPGR